MEFNPSELAAAWLATAKSTGGPKGRAVLSQTVSVELFWDLGVRLVAGDSWTYASVWVPCVRGNDDEAPAEPPLELEPTSTIVAHDPHGRALKLFTFALTLANEAAKDDEEAPPVRLEIQTASSEGMLDPSFAPRQLKLSVAGSVERLDSIDQPYPDWRLLFQNRSTTTTDHVGLRIDASTKLSAIAKTLGSGVMRWDFNGPLGSVRVDFVERSNDLHLIAIALPHRLPEDREVEAPKERTSEATGNTLLDDLEAFLAESADAAEAEQSETWDDLVANVARYLVGTLGVVSNDAVATHFEIGQAMTMRIVERLERLGVVSALMDTDPPRSLLITSPNVLEVLIPSWAAEPNDEPDAT